MFIFGILFDKLYSRYIFDVNNNKKLWWAFWVEYKVAQNRDS